jgi:hypothetical protein
MPAKGSPLRAAVAASALLAAALGLAACGGPSVSVARQRSAIAATWTRFFDPSTSLAERVALLQGGAAHRAQLRSLTKLIVPGLTAKVVSVAVHGTTATVKYELEANGQPLLPSASTGTAVEVPGKPYDWQVSSGTFCGLAALAGSPCPSSG